MMHVSNSNLLTARLVKLEAINLKYGITRTCSVWTL